MPSFIQLTSDEPQLDGAQRVLKAKDYVLALDAEQVLEQAKQKAAAIVAEAQEQYEAEKARGRADGLAEAQAEIAEQMLTLVSRSVDYLAGAETDVARVVMACLRKILGEFSDEELAVRQARAALQVVRNEPRVTVRVRPELEVSVRERVGDILRGNGEVSILEVVGDERLEHGGCRLETDAGVVDASLEQQLKALERVMGAKQTSVPDKAA